MQAVDFGFPPTWDFNLLPNNNQRPWASYSAALNLLLLTHRHGDVSISNDDLRKLLLESQERPECFSPKKSSALPAASLLWAEALRSPEAVAQLTSWLGAAAGSSGHAWVTVFNSQDSE